MSFLLPFQGVNGKLYVLVHGRTENGVYNTSLLVEVLCA